MKYQTEVFGSFFPGLYLVLIMDYFHSFEYKACHYYLQQEKLNGKFPSVELWWRKFYFYIKPSISETKHCLRFTWLKSGLQITFIYKKLQLKELSSTLHTSECLYFVWLRWTICDHCDWFKPLNFSFRVSINWFNTFKY